MEVPDINNLGKLLSLKQQLPTLQIDGVLAQPGVRIQAGSARGQDGQAA
jgi:hypothetical protein